MWGLGSCRWWPLVGVLLFGLPFVFGFLGFKCDRTEPGVTTDTASTAQQSVSEPANAGPSPIAFVVPAAGGLLVAGAALRRNRET